jgi:hypothetical protein
MTAPPMIWLRASLWLRTRPASTADTIRATRSSPSLAGRHRIGGHRRRREDLVVHHLGGRQRAADITTIDVLPPPIEQDRCTRIVDPQHRSGLFVLDLDQSRRGTRVFARRRDHDGHMLAHVQDPVVPQREWGRRAEPGHRCLDERGCVLVCDHREDARRGLRVRYVDAPDRSDGDRGLHQHGMCEIGKGEIRWVPRGAGHLERPIDPID